MRPSTKQYCYLLTISTYVLITLFYYHFFIDPNHPKVSSPITNEFPRHARIAYFISGSSGDGEPLKRSLLALYHPYNTYVVCLDHEASVEERRELSDYIGNHPIFSFMRNVRTIGSPANLSMYPGLAEVVNTIRAVSVLIDEGGKWDWFVNLGADSYPLVTQDDLLYVLSRTPRHLNFIQHTSHPGLEKNGRKNPRFIDPRLLSEKEDTNWSNEERKLPNNTLVLFTGSPWMALSRSFAEYSGVWWWDNLPRLAEIYDTNYTSSMESYFQTVICNSIEFRNTTINTDLHVVARHNRLVRTKDSNPPFIGRFSGVSGDGVLDWIDEHLLQRYPGRLVPGGWCNVTSERAREEAGSDDDSTDDLLCSRVGSAVDFRPGSGAVRLHRFLYRLINNPISEN